MMINFPSLSLLDSIFTVSWLLGAYLLGSVPVAWLLAHQVSGRDLRTMGSGNVGVMNTALSVARWAGLLVFLTEIAKGILVVAIPRLLGAENYLIGLGIIAAVAGTRWPVWLEFKGGRGNTTGMAACLMISYPGLLATVACWVLARLSVKKSFTATRITLVMLPFIFWLTTQSAIFTFTALMLSLIYLGAQHQDSDDHLLIKQRWTSFWAFLTSPPRR
jgi:glycerol-3-phosphate acyltransferase PlsY